MVTVRIWGLRPSHDEQVRLERAITEAVLGITELGLADSVHDVNVIFPMMLQFGLSQSNVAVEVIVPEKGNLSHSAKTKLVQAVGEAVSVVQGQHTQVMCYIGKVIPDHEIWSSTKK